MILIRKEIWGGGATGVKADLIPGAEHPSTALSGLSDIHDLAGLRDLAGPLRPSPALAGPRRLMSAPHTPFGPQCHPSQASGKVQISTFPTRFACYGGHGSFFGSFQFFSFFLGF